MEPVEYRCVLVQSCSLGVLAYGNAGQYRLPRVYIPRATRPVFEVQRAMNAKWGLDIFVLEIWAPADGPGACAIAELLTPEMASSFREVSVEQLMTSELLEDERNRLELFFNGRLKGPFSQLGWVDEGLRWMASATGCAFFSKSDIEQWSAGESFALMRARSDDGRNYWLKATGEPNAHEFAITGLLCKLCPDFLPKLIATKKEWNAWLTTDAGIPLSDSASPTELVSAARRMAQLQLLTIGRTDDLLAAGAFDQRLPALRSRIDALIAYLIKAMARQTSTKAAPLSRDRLLELGEVLRDACFRLEALDIPDALIHNDLNTGNILSDGPRLVFTDWSEAAVGNPLLACERLCQLSPAHAESVRNVYREFWSHQLSAQSMDEALALTPLVAIYAYLYGRGDWIGQRESVLPQFESYARSLARHMDRAARDSSLLEVLCH